MGLGVLRAPFAEGCVCDVAACSVLLLSGQVCEGPVLSLMGVTDGDEIRLTCSGEQWGNLVTLTGVHGAPTAAILPP